MANVSNNLRLGSAGLLLLIIINTSLHSSVSCINKTHRGAIENSEPNVFPTDRDLEFEKFEVFEQFFERDDGNNAFTSRDNPSFTLLVTEADAEMKLVILEVESPETDALLGKVCYYTTYIVFRPIKNFIDHFTSHLAHVRIINGKMSVEWDFFFSDSHDYNGNFVTAFAPDNDIPDQSTWHKGRSMHKGRAIQKGKMMRRIKQRNLNKQANISNTSDSSNQTMFKTETFIPGKPTEIPTVFKGLGRCPQSNARSLEDIEAQGSVTEDEVINYILDTLQVNCLPNYFEKTKRLFSTNLVALNRGIRVKWNRSHPISNSAYLTEPQWVDLISAIYLHAFSNAFTTGGLSQNRTKSSRNSVSPSVQNLIGMSVEIIDLTKFKGLKHHLVKIISTMLITAKAANLFYTLEKDSLAGCFDCGSAASLNRNNTIKLNALIKVLECKVEKLLDT